jgi:hypothetical protein
VYLDAIPNVRITTPKYGRSHFTNESPINESAGIDNAFKIVAKLRSFKK